MWVWFAIPWRFEFGGSGLVPTRNCGRKLYASGNDLLDLDLEPTIMQYVPHITQISPLALSRGHFSFHDLDFRINMGLSAFHFDKEGNLAS